MRKTLAITTALGALSSTPALADDKPTDSKMEIGGFLGIHLWSDNNELGAPDVGPSDELDNSLIFGIRVARRLTSMFSVEGELGLSPATTKHSDTDVVAIGYRLHAMVHPVRFVDDKLEPFALLGVGGFTSASSDTAVVMNDSDAQLHGGVGVKYRMGRDWGVRFDARIMFPPAIDGTATVDGEFLIGIYKGFPPKPVVAPAPVSPLMPPKSEPVVVPGEPPPADTDKDGIVDGSDKCPAEPEDFDGAGDEDGCPDPDNDGDGVPDAADRCPAQAETKNGYQDDDGCPDEMPAEVKKFTGAIKGIGFVTGSDKLTPQSSKVLDEAVKVLAAFPTLKLEISGHTDDKGNADFNRDLSKRRAESVKAYLVSKGVDAGRLQTAGYGPDRPVADNKTDAGRAQNRRVEFQAH